jgi:hypothetical protein
MTMDDQQFVAAVREHLDRVLDAYRQAYAEACAKDLTSIKDEHGRDAIRLISSFDDGQRETFLRIVRRKLVDATANLFSLLDGNFRLKGQDGDFVLELGGRKLNGMLADLFLELEQEAEQGSQGPTSSDTTNSDSH